MTGKVFKPTWGLALAAIGATPVVAATCEELTALELPHATITSATFVEGPQFVDPPAMAPGLAKVKVTVPVCRVSGVSRPSPTSHINFQVWIPTQTWNGKFRGLGNGGLAGSIFEFQLAQSVEQGYVAAATDDGHQGNAVDWLGDPELVADFASRAVHETTVNAKLIIGEFFGRGPTASYFIGGSKGGHEALMEAQRFPEDYDGIVAGVPAFNLTRISATILWNYQATMKSPASRIPPEKLLVLHGAVLRACDTLDGVADGVLENPNACRFDPRTTVCKGAEAPACLTVDQVRTARAIYAGPRNPRTGRAIFPGMPLGSEATSGADPNAMNSWAGFDGLMAKGFSQPILGLAAFGRHDWDPMSYDFDRDQETVDARLAPVLDAADPDLSAFKARSGKLIMYQGWHDSLLVPQAAPEYFNQVVRKMNGGRLNRGTIRETQRFFRLFMVPGMAHIPGGPGPWPNVDDINMLLEDWVEQGVAPERFLATKVVAQDSGPAVTRTRLICPYPQTARWNRTGSTDDAASFVCADERR